MMQGTLYIQVNVIVGPELEWLNAELGDHDHDEHDDGHVDPHVHIPRERLHQHHAQGI